MAIFYYAPRPNPLGSLRPRTVKSIGGVLRKDKTKFAVMAAGEQSHETDMGGETHTYIETI